jgi:hypothetical protein
LVEFKGVVGPWLSNRKEISGKESPWNIFQKKQASPELMELMGFEE